MRVKPWLIGLFAACWLSSAALPAQGPYALQLKKEALDYQRCVMRAAIEAAKNEKPHGAMEQINRSCAALAQRFLGQQVRYGISLPEAKRNTDTLRKRTFKVVGSYMILFASTNSQLN
jgi:hypothetical protein